MSRVLAVVGFEVLFVGLALIWRSLQQRRNTGSTGFVALKERGPRARVAALAMVAGVVGLAAGPVAAYGQVHGWDVVSLVAVVLMVGGLVLTLVAQQQMGGSWRIGVDPDEQTELVTAGVFGRIRNPIFTAMIAFGVGVALGVPNVWALAGATLLAFGIVAQVLVVEEPYLRRVHGAAYAAYVSSTGRFLPRVRPAARAGTGKTAEQPTTGAR